VIRAFGEIGDERAVPLLLEAMTDRAPDSYFMTPSFAARALSRIGGEQVVEGLRGHLEEGEPTVRRMATMVLGHIGDDDAIDVLRFALEDDDRKVRAIAIEALKKIGTPRAHALIYASRDLM
jgi:HEAT repeat protein